MSPDAKHKIKVKREPDLPLHRHPDDDDDRILLVRASKSPKDGTSLKQEKELPPQDVNQVKREKTDVKPVKREKETALKASGKVKIEHEYVVVKKEHDSVKKEPGSGGKVVKVKRDQDTLGSVKRELDAVKKERGSGGKDTGKIKIVKKEGSVSSGKSVSSKEFVTAKKKKKSKEKPEKKGRKVYDLPGQKHDPPEERDPLRVFYESLYEQNPRSEMAELWMMEHGLLPRDVAKKAFDRKQRRQQNQKMGTPVKSSKDGNLKSEKSSSANGDSKVSVKSKRKQEDSDDDDDFIVKPKKKLKMNA